MRGRWPKYGRAIYRTKRWQAVRQMVRRRDGWKCVQCSSEGRLEVDHIKPIRDGGAAYDMANLQCLCRSCHSQKTAAEIELRGSLPPERQKWRDLLQTPLKETKHA